MKLTQKIVDSIAPRMGARQGNELYDSLEYGAKIAFMNIPKFIVLMVLALLLGVLQGVLWFMLVYAALRFFSFGVHFESAIRCTLLGLCYYLGSVYIATYATIPVLLKVAILGICICVFCLYAPAETKRRTIPEKREPQFKFLSTVILTIASTASLLTHEKYPLHSNLFCLAAVCQSINLLPITYKVIRRVEHA